MYPTEEDMAVLYNQYRSDMQAVAKANGYPKPDTTGRNPSTFFMTAGTISFLLSIGAMMAALGAHFGMGGMEFFIAAALSATAGLAFMLISAITGEPCEGCR